MAESAKSSKLEFKILEWTEKELDKNQWKRSVCDTELMKTDNNEDGQCQRLTYNLDFTTLTFP